MRNFLIEYIFAVDNRVADNNRAIEIQTSNRRLHVGERTVYLGFAFGKPIFFGASILRDVHAIANLRYNFRVVFRNVFGN